MSLFNFIPFRLTRKRILLGALSVFIFFGSALTSYYFFDFINNSSGDQESKDEPEKATQAQQELLDLETSGLGDDLEKTYNLLLLGYGGAGHDGGYLTDAIKVVNVNPEKKEIVVISIPRDLWVELPVRSDKREYFKINAAYAIGFDDTNYPLKEPQYKGEKGALRMVKEALGKVTGIPVDYYLAVDFEGFKKAIDILGELEVNVPVAFDDYFYPVKGLENEICGKSSEEIVILHEKYSGFQLEKQFECRYEHLHFEAGVQSMDGETVLKFVRSRHSDTHGGDFARAQRQLAVLLAIKKKIVTTKILDNLPSFFDRFAGVLKTDINLQAAKELLIRVPDIAEFEIKSIHLTDENVLKESKSSSGQFILIPKEGVGKWEEVQNFIKGQ